MLNRRMLRVKAFKVLYSYAENRDMTLKDALAALDASCEATRDLSVYLLSIVIPLTAEAARQAEALRLKFNPTEEELHPNLKFVRNGLAPLLESDPDFQKFLERKKYSWDQDDALIHRVLEAETFPEIPVRVTINEYVELSKYYSTPKSRSFVNGILDRLIKESAAEGRINKADTPVFPKS